MHQSFDCGNFRSKLQKLKAHLDALDLLISYSKAAATTNTARNYVRNAERAMEEIRKEIQ